jgi:hypothetical protein
VRIQFSGRKWTTEKINSMIRSLFSEVMTARATSSISFVQVVYHDYGSIYAGLGNYIKSHNKKFLLGDYSGDATFT